MKKSLTLGLTLLLSAFILQACSPAAPGTTTGTTSGKGSETSESTSDKPAGPLEFSFDFNEGDNGFEAGFADLPVDYEDNGYDLDSGMADLPAELGDSRGYRIKGMNRSDDLFMFLTKELGPDDGIKANQTYKLHIELEFASNAFSGSMGIGGSPAESVYVKAGASSIKPEAKKEEEGDFPMYLMNIDKGQQAEGGKDAKVIGNVAKQDGSEDESFSIVKLNSEDVELMAKSDSEGRLWLIVGTDSGFEGQSELYYTNIKVTLTP